MIELDLEVVSYTDSLFTNVHDLTSHAPTVDGRGTFTHLGVKMEGLESARHLNFCIDDEMKFKRNTNTQNIVELRVKDGQVAEIERVEFDTSYYTRNNVKTVHSLLFIDCRNNSSTSFGDIQLKGDSKLTKDVKAVASSIFLNLSEGGLTRFKAYGKLVGKLDRGADLLHDNDQQVSVFGASDASYGDPALVLRTRREGTIMAGWESCRHSYRHRVAFSLAKPCKVSIIEIDTYLHCLNAFKAMAVLVSDSQGFPTAAEELIIDEDSVLLSQLPKWDVYDASGNVVLTCADENLNEIMDTPSYADHSYKLNADSSSIWKVLLPFVPLNRDTLHTIDTSFGIVNPDLVVRTLCLIGVPDGGIHRFGIYGSFV